MSEFFSMGGYGLYIWPCFLITLLVMGGLAVSSWIGWRRQTALFARLQAQQPASGEGA